MSGEHEIIVGVAFAEDCGPGHIVMLPSMLALLAPRLEPAFSSRVGVQRIALTLLSLLLTTMYV